MKNDFKMLYINFLILLFNSIEWFEDFLHFFGSILKLLASHIALFFPFMNFFILAFIFFSNDIKLITFVSLLWFFTFLLGTKFLLNAIFESKRFSIVVSAIFFSFSFWFIFLIFGKTNTEIYLETFDILKFPLILTFISNNFLFFLYLYEKIRREKKKEIFEKQKYDIYKNKIYYKVIELPKISGIYKINDEENSKIYIGKANNIRARINNHLITLKNNTHQNKNMQEGFNSSLINNGRGFSFEVLEVLPFNYDALSELEHQKIKEYNSTDSDIGYNKIG